MYPKKLLYSFILFFCLLNTLTAQVILKGVIRDSSAIKGSGVMASASFIDGVTLLNTIITDSSGNFSIVLPSNKKIQISISSLGYNKYTQNIKVSKDTLIIIGLIQLSKELNEVIVRAEKPLIQYDLDKVILNVRDNKFLTGKNLLSILDYAPGVWIDPINKAISMKGSPVSLYINDRKVSMSGDELNAYLSSLSANNIKSIELISNPPAKYDAQGSGGIINITLYKAVDDGVEVSVENTAKQGIYFDDIFSTQVNAQIKKKLTLYGSFSNSFGTDVVNWTEKSNFLETNSLQDYVQQNKTKFNRNNLRLGLGYQFDKKNTFSLELFKNNSSINGLLSSYGIITSNSNTFLLQSYRDNQSNGQRLNLNSNYKRLLDTMGRQVLVVFDYSDIDNSDNSNYLNQYSESDRDPKYNNIRFSNQSSMYKIFSFRTDVDYPISKDKKMEFGLKYGYTDNNSVLDFKNKIGENLIQDPLLSNKFNYQESILAAYSTLQTTIGKSFLAKVGFRLEYTKGAGLSATLNQNQSREYLDLFPSIYLQKKFYKDKHTLNLSYSRRINRPSFKYYNPFVSYSSEFVSYTGNPNVLPEYTNSYEANINFNGGITLNTYYKESVQTLDEVQLRLGDNIKYQYRNLDHYKNLGISLNLQQKVTNKWDISFFSTAYLKRYESIFTDASNVDNTSSAYFLRITNNISLGKGYQTSLTAFYSSREVYGQRIISGLYSVNAFISKAILKSKVNLSLSCEDLLNSYREVLNIQQQSLTTLIDRTYERRTFSLSMRYNFKTGKKVTRVSKKESNEEETRRSY